MLFDHFLFSRLVAPQNKKKMEYLSFGQIKIFSEEPPEYYA